MKLQFTLLTLLPLVQLSLATAVQSDSGSNSNFTMNDNSANGTMNPMSSGGSGSSSTSSSSCNNAFFASILAASLELYSCPAVATVDKSAQANADALCPEDAAKAAQSSSSSSSSSSSGCQATPSKCACANIKQYLDITFPDSIINNQCQGTQAAVGKQQLFTSYQQLCQAAGYPVSSTAAGSLLGWGSFFATITILIVNLFAFA